MTREQRSILAVSAIVAALAGPAATAEATPSVVHADRQALASVPDVSDYWTPKRMREAKPVGIVKVPGAPSPVASPAAPQAGGSGIELQASGPLIPYTSFELTDTLSFPNRVHGKVFFTKPGNGNFVCSGTVVNGTNDSTVITAGHCVWDGAWATNFAFVPGYRNGSAPYGVWPASSEFSTDPWVQIEDLRYDIGAVVVKRNSSDQELEDVVGARGIAFNQPTEQHYRSHGYPAQSPFDGSKLWACESDFGFPDDPTGGLLGDGPPTMAIGCNMNGGSSGGGWVINDQDVVSLNSYKYPNVPNLAEVMFGPYFGDTALALFNQAQGESPGVTTTPTQGATTPPPTSSAVPVTSPQPKCKKSKKKHRKKHRKKRCRR